MIGTALNAYASTFGKTWATDRSQTVGASEIGQCARRVYFLKNEGDGVYGANRDADHEDGWGAQLRGTFYENAFWTPAMRQTFGDRMLYAGADQTTFVDGFLSATPDGVIVGLPSDVLAPLGVPDIQSDCVVADCKSIDPRFRLDEPKSEHAYQIQVQIGLVRLRTNHQPFYGVLSYTNASFWDDVTEFVIPFDDEVFSSAQRRATAIMTARSADDLRPEGYIAGGKECDNCPFRGPCGVLRVARVPQGEPTTPLVPELKAEIVALATEAKALRAASEQAEKQAKIIEQQVRDALAKAGVRKTATDKVSVSWSAVNGRTSWDMDGLTTASEEAGVDVSSFRKEGPPSDRLTITLKGKSKDENR